MGDKTVKPSEKASKKSSKTGRWKKGYAFGSGRLGVYGDGYRGEESREQSRARFYADKQNAKRRQMKLKYKKVEDTPELVAERVLRAKKAALAKFKKWLDSPAALLAARDPGYGLAYWINDANLDDLLPDHYLEEVAAEAKP